MNWFDGAVGAVGAAATILLWLSLAGGIDYPDPFLTAIEYSRKSLGK